MYAVLNGKPKEITQRRKANGMAAAVAWCPFCNFSTQEDSMRCLNPTCGATFAEGETPTVDIHVLPPEPTYGPVTIVCDRCHQSVEGVVTDEGIGGFYRGPAWQKYMDGDEKEVCDACMQTDSRFIADHPTPKVDVSARSDTASSGSQIVAPNGSKDAWVTLAGTTEVEVEVPLDDPPKVNPLMCDFPECGRGPFNSAAGMKTHKSMAHRGL